MFHVILWTEKDITAPDVVLLSEVLKANTSLKELNLGCEKKSNERKERKRMVTDT